MKNYFKHKYNHAVLLACFVTPLQAAEWSGKITSEYRVFTESPSDSRQHGNNLSVSAEPEFYHEFEDKQSILIKLFTRWDEGDEQRSHSDVREFLWQKVADNWEVKVGIGKVYWGVTESQHLVDIINQTDLVESFDREEKLGQSLINLSLIQNWGNLDFFILPTFREQTYPGTKGRLRFTPSIDTSQAQYDSKDRDKHVDYAMRYFQSFDALDVGLSIFNGTTRDPRFTFGTNNQNQVVLIPFYDLITQTGLDVQATLDSWLLKLEWIHRSGQGSAFNAATGGFEYTLYGILDGDTDLGLLMEYLYDERGNAATTPFDNDILLGARFAFNDTQSTDLLIGFISDLDNVNPSVSLEASRRLTDHFKLNIEGRIFKETTATDLINAFRNDDYIQLELEYYF
ncbi:hypothetical protein MNBD_GAMMA22-1656 [hydrothermal vent metagenome]|uniref:Alginate export domain-containing protein n=1 Tax=hydrothermal vent metagenome TaxID=652676 RepID=A0A3B0ZN31_9ZZZZ